MSTPAAPSECSSGPTPNPTRETQEYHEGIGPILTYPTLEILNADARERCAQDIWQCRIFAVQITGHKDPDWREEAYRAFATHLNDKYKESLGENQFEWSSVQNFGYHHVCVFAPQAAPGRGQDPVYTAQRAVLEVWYHEWMDKSDDEQREELYWLTDKHIADLEALKGTNLEAQAAKVSLTSRETSIRRN